MRKLLSIGLIFAIIFLPGAPFSSIRKGAKGIAGSIVKSNYTVLLCGYDEAAYNTDSIILLNYDSRVNTVSFLQIPRDTYYNFSNGQNKINQFVPEKVFAGVSLSDAMEEFKSEISSALGITIDAYAGYTMRAVADIVDSIGGIDIDVPVPITGIDLNGNTVNLKSGRNHLTGAESIVFLRYRKGYALGDLSRIDAQKLFLSSLSDKLRSGLNTKSLIKLLTDGSDTIITNLNGVEITCLALKNKSRIDEANILFANLAGMHILSENGISYFCVNKHSSSELIIHLPFSRCSSFDNEGKFLKAVEKTFSDCYNSEEIKFNIYTQNELKKIEFITN